VGCVLRTIRQIAPCRQWCVGRTLQSEQKYKMMAFPIDFHLGNFTIDSHLVFELLAYIVGFRYYLYLRQHTIDKFSSEQRLAILTGAAGGALVGSKLLGLLEHPELFELITWSISGVTYVFASKTIVGGLLGGICGVEVTKQFLRIKYSSGDLFCLPLILGMIIGRIGCFLAGVEDSTHGLPTTFILGLDLGDGIKRHPTALYEIMFLLGLWGSLYWWQRSAHLVEGSLFKGFMVAYLSWRLGIDFIKPVSQYEPLGLSAIQLACVGGLLYYHRVLLFPKLMYQPKMNYSKYGK